MGVSFSSKRHVHWAISFKEKRQAPTQNQALYHPDFNRRSRNFTGSADPPKTGEALADYNRRWGISPRPENSANWPANSSIVKQATLTQNLAMTATPILYSFRRCPYAMRARLAIASSGIRVELREILLRDKAPEFVKTSPKATV